MRLTDTAIVKRFSTGKDKYGGTSTTELFSKSMDVSVSIRYDQMRFKPSGLGYYRRATIMIKQGALAIGDKVIYNGGTYTITEKVPYSHQFVEVFIGYEV